jgi:hypothetical protein
VQYLGTHERRRIGQCCAFAHLPPPRTPEHHLYLTPVRGGAAPFSRREFQEDDGSTPSCSFCTHSVMSTRG